MKNYVQPGMNLEVVAPAAVSSGDGVMVGDLFGVASGDAESGATMVLATEGVFELSKVSAAVLAQGGKCYWDAGVSDDDTKPMIGYAIEAAGAGVLKVKVKLAP